MDKVPLTIKGFAALEEELKHRQQVERPRIIQAISEARALGDLSENAEYHAAKEAQSLNEGRILELESLICPGAHGQNHRGHGGSDDAGRRQVLRGSGRPVQLKPGRPARL
jgi:hypothetical protein